MSADRSAAGSDRQLAALIRRSRVLDPVLKRQWLRLLPHLAAADRARLHEILSLEQAAARRAQLPTRSDDRPP